MLNVQESSSKTDLNTLFLSCSNSFSPVLLLLQKLHWRKAKCSRGGVPRGLVNGRSLSSLLHSDSCRNLGLSSNPVTSNVMLQPGSSSEGNPSSSMHQVFKELELCRRREEESGENFQSSSIADVSQNAHALFKARFEQALESQKLNIRKTEQQLRRTESGVNVLQCNRQKKKEAQETERVDEDSDQEELDRFIAEIEEAADKEWEEEEAAEEEESGRIRYWNREEFAGRNRGPYGGDSSHGFRRNERDTRNQRRSNDSDDSDQLDSEDDVIPKRFDRPTLIFSVVSFSFCGSSERRRE
ncbi:hypothetical protein HID58_084273 [Brassica napus]|uniref:Uncharacterized protein n=1 Tax=Brassica napus TaxID=3708 RepID=A0ABQ7XJE0_BRANA|nr:hypothetical protein HID58_084273 [Brassica napus]